LRLALSQTERRGSAKFFLCAARAISPLSGRPGQAPVASSCYDRIALYLSASEVPSADDRRL
jgi:hypothetical protein